MNKKPKGVPLTNFPLSPTSKYYTAINRIDWEDLNSITTPFRGNYVSMQPLRRILGLITFKKLFKCEYEILLTNWLEIPGMQYFTGEEIFHLKSPITPNEIAEIENNLSKDSIDFIENAITKIKDIKLVKPY